MSSQALIIPPQSAPPLSGVAPLTADGRGADVSKVLFNLPLWLFLNGIARAINTGANEGGAGGGGGAGVAAVLDVILSPGTTVTSNPTPPANVGSMLYVFVKAAGPSGVLAWGANVKWAPTQLDSVANTWTVFSLVGRTDPADAVLKWFYVGIGVTGQPS